MNEPIREALERLQQCVLSVSTRYFCAPMYLVGSAVDGERVPRDLDVVIVLEDYTFEVAYGAGTETVSDWRSSHGVVEPRAIWLRWARDCAKQGLELTRLCRMLVDFKVQPRSFFEGSTLPKRRLDTWGAPQTL